MKVAIIAPSSVPYTVGGAEKLWWGMLHHINQLTPHQPELIKIPSPEHNFWELMDSYRAFSLLDLNHFDKVISTKYPAWMVDHPNHHCFLQHKLRGLYDTYHFCGQPIEIGKLPSVLSPLVELITGSDIGRDLLTPLWNELNNASKQDIAEQAFAFPGPLTRGIVHFLDQIAMRPDAIKRYSAISQNVANRKDYFPPNVSIVVNHHPTDLPCFDNTGYDYIFTISRLDGPKRIAMLVEAFMKTTADIEFRIAGTGPEESVLRALAKNDSRIRFLGRISDDDVIAEYAGALFVPFIPYDEDYGLITIEAMKSSKAVLTTSDAGGVTEFVTHELTGLIVEPNVESLTEGIRQLVENREATCKMGEKAQERVANISWQNTLDMLFRDDGRVDDHNKPTGGTKKIELTTGISLGSTSFAKNGARNSAETGKRHIVVALTFPVWPPQGGGQNRIYYLYSQLAKQFEITLVTLTHNHDIARDWVIAPGLREIRIPKSETHQHEEQKLEQLLNASVGDIAAIQYYSLTSDYLLQLKKASEHADVVVCSHPYLYYAVREVYQGELWYEAHNVELDMKSAILPQSLEGQRWLEETRKAEQACCQDSTRVMTCCEDDSRRLAALYKTDISKFQVVPNGVSIVPNGFLLPSQRQELRQSLGLKNKTALFMGSWHGPNIEAVEWINQNARIFSEIDILIIGSICEHSVCDKVASNIHPLGLVSDEEKQVLMNAVHIAINPIESGSGTNLKMLDYAAAGTPILTTPHGMRGLLFNAEEDIHLADIEDFAKAITKTIAEKPERLDVMAEKARDKTQSTYDWIVIAREFLESVE
ncbi:MAG: glycosyltransferase family 4 protein [Methylococcales bacterium]